MKVCVHAHCYQPPREDPETGLVPLEQSAHPHHDWNARITDECYRPFAAARILDDDGHLERAINLYSLVSFNVAPTLATWLDRYAPDVMAAMVTGDRQARARPGGHGTAVAQPWVHAILPLASARDRQTMILWGSADFEGRFGRPAEGMWLPETAVDTPTLESLADAGISFTVCAPHQALASHETEPVDPHAPIEVTLPSGRKITLFVYDGSVAHGVAFGDLLEDGRRFAAALAPALFGQGDSTTFRSLAVDAETFGHHKRFGEMGLAKALSLVEQAGGEVTTFNAWRASGTTGRPGTVVENSSWSCAHGVERWRADCGCHCKPHTTQRWRAPLREAIDWLVGVAVDLTESRATSSMDDPWTARDEYVRVLIGTEQATSFALRHARAGVAPSTVTEWMEAHRHLLLAQSSCAWFFDDADGHETLLGIRQAEAAIARLELLTGASIRAGWDEAMSHLMVNEPPTAPT